MRLILEAALPHLAVLAGVTVAYVTNDLATAAFILALTTYVRQK